MPSLIDAETMWTCETCFHHKTGKCDPAVWCENGECYRPDMSKLKILSFDDFKTLLVCDTLGLTPEELEYVHSLERGYPVLSPNVTLFGKPLEHWKELHIAELQGRLFILPCKIGDTVYQTDGVRVYESTVRKLIFDTENIAFDVDAVNRTVFTTREAAEMALLFGNKKEESPND